MDLSIIEALQATSEYIANWARRKFATGLTVIDDKLYLKNNNGVIEDSAVVLPSGGVPDISGEFIFDCGCAPIMEED